MIKIGNIDDTPYEDQLYIYDAETDSPKACLSVPDDTMIKAELMGEHYIQFSFNWNSKIDFIRTDYIRINNIIYTLREDYQPTEVNTQEYKYTIRFDAPEMLWIDFILFYTFQNYKEAQWTLTGTAEQFLQIAVDNIQKYLNDDEWTVGAVDPTETINISFDSQNVFDGLTDIAEAFNCEWYVDYTVKTINLVSHHETGDIVTLQRDISLTDITRSNENNEDYCTRLFAFGSTRNIPTNYRNIESGSVIDAIVQKRLRLPAIFGDYIDAYPNLRGKAIIERVKVFDHIYPKRTGEITALRVKEEKDDNGNPFFIYYFKDAGLQFKSDYIIPGETLMLQFGENSWLSGRSFELSYNDKTQEYEIINDQSTDITVPNDVLKPRIGDFYTLYNFDISMVGDKYVPEAEEELLKEAQEWMDSIKEDNATYNCKMASRYIYDNNIDLSIGQRVRIKSKIFNNGEKVSRVYGFEKGYQYYNDTYIVGNNPRYSRLAKIDKTIEENKKTADLQYLEAMKRANSAYKNTQALNYLRTALENETSIDGGLILTSLIRLGAMVGSEWKESAGVNGIVTENGDDPAFWAGGTIEDAVNNLASIILRMDGSGQLASGNILWDALGNLLMSGTFESNKNGNRIIIDPETRSLRLINDIDQVLIEMSFERGEQPGTGKVFYSPKILINHYGWNTEGDPLFTTEISNGEIRIKGSDGYVSFISSENIGFFNAQDQSQPSFSATKGTDLNGNTCLLANLVGLPTSIGSIYEGLYTSVIDGKTVICKK